MPDEFGFEFSIGDIVKRKGTWGEDKSFGDPAQADVRMTIISMHLERCEGGIQRCYSCRVFQRGGHSLITPIRLFGFELEPIEKSSDASGPVVDAA